MLSKHKYYNYATVAINKNEKSRHNLSKNIVLGLFICYCSEYFWANQQDLTIFIIMGHLYLFFGAKKADVGVQILLQDYRKMVEHVNKKWLSM